MCTRQENKGASLSGPFTCSHCVSLRAATSGIDPSVTRIDPAGETAGTRCSVSARNRSQLATVVFVVGDVFAQVVALARSSVLKHGDVFHEAAGSSSVPVPLAWRGVERQAGVTSMIVPSRPPKRPTPWVTRRYWPCSWECQAVWAPGADRTVATTMVWSDSWGSEIGSSQT